VTDPRSRVRVVLTMRADFYDRPLHYPDFGELVRNRMETVLPLSADELERCIRRPAELVGVTYEDGLVSVIIEEVLYQSGALPLLQYALTELFDNRRGRLLTQDAYREMGGTIGALAKRADEIFENLTVDGQELARQMFLRLVTLGEGVEDTRRRVPRSELIAITENQDLMDEIIDTYTNYRLLSLDNDPGTRTPTVEVAHEAILREWERLRGWLDDSRADIRDQRALARVGSEWAASGSDASFLLRGSRLKYFEAWANETDLALTGAERSFLDASLEAQRQRVLEETKRQAREVALEQRSRRFSQALVVVFAIATVIAVILSLFAFNAQQIAQNEAEQRATAQAVAEEERAIALEQSQLAKARELAFAAANNLDVDPERSVLLALEAIKTKPIIESTNALHQALPSLHILSTIPAHLQAPGIAFNPNGTDFASIGVYGTTKIWDAATFQLRQTLSVEPDSFGIGIAYSPDGKLLATALDTKLIIWDALTGQRLFDLVGDFTGGSVNHIVFAPKPTASQILVAIAQMDGVPQVWDLTTRKQVLTLTGHDQPCEGVAFSPDGTRLATGDIAGTIKIWDAATGEALLTLEQDGQIHNLVFSPDSTRLAVAGNNGVIWDAATGQIILNLSARSVLYSITFMPDGEHIVSAHQDGTTILWDAATGQQVLVLAGHVSTVIDVAASPDNQRLVTSGYDGSVRVWDTAPGSELLTLEAHDDQILEIAYSPDGTHLGTVSLDGTAKLWDASTGKLVISLANENSVAGLTGLAFSLDGTRLATGNEKGVVDIWDTGTGILLQSLEAHTSLVLGMAFNPNGGHLATTSWDGMAKVWDIESGKEITVIQGDDMHFNVSFSPDGKRLFMACNLQKVGCELDAETGEILRIFPPGGGVEVYGIAISNSGNLLALGWDNGFISIWDLVSGEMLNDFLGHTGIVHRLAFSEDGNHLASAGFDGFAKVWDVQNGQEVATLYGHSGNVFGVSFDGDHLATAGGDGTARIYTMDMTELVDLAYSRLTVPRWVPAV